MASTSILRTVAVRKCRESIKAVFVLRTLKSVSRHDSNWRTSVNLHWQSVMGCIDLRPKCTYSPARIHLSRAFMRSQTSNR